MPFDPKILSNATQKIEQHLSNFEKRKKDYEARLAEVAKRLQALDKMTDSVLSTTEGLLKELGEARAMINMTLKNVEGYSIEAKKGGDYEMTQRRYLDSKKTWLEAGDNVSEKFDAWQKNKTDKKAQQAYELAEKAAQKISIDVGKLQVDAQEMYPTKLLRSLDLMTGELPKDIDQYEKLLKQLLERVKPDELRGYMKRFEKY